MEFTKHAVDVDLILGDNGLQLVALSLAFATVTLVLKGDVDCIVFVTVGIELVVIFGPRDGVCAVFEGRVALSSADSLVLIRALLLNFKR